MIGTAAARLAGGATIAASMVLLIVTACGGPRRPSLAVQVATADTLVAEGCYHCLDEAVVRYFALPPARGAAAAATDSKLFRALVFLALREKELGLDASQRLKQARSLLPHVTAPAAAAEQLRWAELVQTNPSALPRDVGEMERGRLLAERDAIGRRLAAAATAGDLLDVYINVTLACTAALDRQAPDPAAIAAPAAAAPIVQWRLATCGRRQEAELKAFAAAHPRYVEADYWFGHHALAMSGDPRARREARERLTAANEAIPGSLAILFELAGVTRVTSPKEALPIYERITHAQPHHHEALLGQGICLTYLDRSADAIPVLTALIDLGRWYTGEGLYWRAWNQHRLGNLDAAWADVTRARTTWFNTDVFGLAGRIAHDRHEYDVARPLLAQAIALSDANCQAAWYLGLVESAQARWLDGGAAFEAAERCYRTEIDRLREDEQNASREVEEAVRATRLAEASASIQANQRQAALAAYNAAYDFVKGGDEDRSRPLLDRAVLHPDVTDRARELRAFVDR
jgi:tetratricopeptide (TPR) repeat protein